MPLYERQAVSIDGARRRSQAAEPGGGARRRSQAAEPGGGAGRRSQAAEPGGGLPISPRTTDHRPSRRETRRPVSRAGKRTRAKVIPSRRVVSVEPSRGRETKLKTSSYLTTSKSVGSPAITPPLSGGTLTLVFAKLRLRKDLRIVNHSLTHYYRYRKSCTEYNMKMYIYNIL